jgi:hypothetical protein
MRRMIELVITSIPHAANRSSETSSTGKRVGMLHPRGVRGGETGIILQVNG